MSDIAIVVPARLASKRFPRKLLHLVQDKPLILWTAERIASEAPDIPLHFAVEDEELFILLEHHGYQPIKTSAEHPSGTDRIAEANEKIQADYIINVQADEPLVTASQIETLKKLILDPDIDMATMAAPFSKLDDFRDPDKVKVVFDNQNRALYFSRSPIPFARSQRESIEDESLQENTYYWHLGLYAYTAEFINKFRKMPPGRLEMIERLEQLRALENGCTIAVGITNEPAAGVDVPADIEGFKKRISV
jgi:3-deoxy-manno-octulosonate cytidylyltransferase (CMP-KDO synthetase)